MQKFRFILIWHYPSVLYIYQAFDRQTEFSRVFNFAILTCSPNSRKFDAREKCVLQYAVVCIAINQCNGSAQFNSEY